MVLWCGCHTDRVTESAKAETFAEVSGEIQLCPRQSLIDNRLWQPALRTKSYLLDAWMVFVDCQSTTIRESEVQVGGLLLYNNYALFICRYCSLLNNRVHLFSQALNHISWPFLAVLSLTISMREEHSRSALKHHEMQLIKQTLKLWLGGSLNTVSTCTQCITFTDSI